MSRWLTLPGGGWDVDSGSQRATHANISVEDGRSCLCWLVVLPALAGERGEPSPVRQHTNGVEGMANACQTRSKRPETTTYPPEQPPIRLLYRAPEISPMLCRCAARTQEGVIKSLQPHTHQYRRQELFTRAINKGNFPAGVPPSVTPTVTPNPLADVAWGRVVSHPLSHRPSRPSIWLALVAAGGPCQTTPGQGY